MGIDAINYGHSDAFSIGGSKVSKLRKSARGQQCQIRVVGICNGDPETVVLAHLNGGGMGTKRHDIHGAYACSACHAAVDGRLPTVRTGYQECLGRDELRLLHLDGIIRTQEIMLREGLIRV